jgi:hypothetical protein
MKKNKGTALFTVAIITTSLLLVHVPQIILAQGHYGGVIRMNDIIGGIITDQVHYIEYTFSGSAGQGVYIFLEAAGYGNLDAYLKLRGPGITSCWDDDGWFGQNSFLQVTLPQTGAYTVTATRYKEHDGSSAGSFLLLVTESNPTVAYYGVLSPNQKIVGAISDDIYGIEHTFSGQRGENVTITMKKFGGCSLDTYLKLRGPDGAEIAANDDGWTGTNSKIEITLPQTGAYTIHATRYNRYRGSTSGEYILCITSDLHPAGQGGVLRPNQIIMGYIDRNLSSVTYSFDYTGPLNRGVNITVRTQHAGQNASIELYGPDNNQVTSVSPNSRIAVLTHAQVSRTGTYSLKVRTSKRGYYIIVLRHPAFAR